VTLEPLGVHTIGNSGIDMSEKPNFGPYWNWASISAFSELSEKAFTLFDKFINENWSLLSRPVHHLFLRMAYQAKTTSFGIRLNNSWALNLPAFAMTRIRLEQTIVCSYLVHEEESVGLLPFVRYIPIGQHKGLRVAMEDPSLSKELSKLIDPKISETEAVEEQEKFTPGFSLSKGTFERNWTKLDLCSMAKKRDTLVNASASILKHSLEREYISIYKVASSILHADCSSLSYSYLDLFQTPSGEPVLMAVPSWAIIVSASIAHYDILQCYEILEWLGISAGQDYEHLMAEWIEARDKHISCPPWVRLTS
jgi:hypothetical protein